MFRSSTIVEKRRLLGLCCPFSHLKRNGKVVCGRCILLFGRFQEQRKRLFVVFLHSPAVQIPGGQGIQRRRMSRRGRFAQYRDGPRTVRLLDQACESERFFIELLSAWFGFARRRSIGRCAAARRPFSFRLRLAASHLSSPSVCGAAIDVACRLFRFRGPVFCVQCHTRRVLWSRGASCDVVCRRQGRAVPVRPESFYTF